VLFRSLANNPKQSRWKNALSVALAYLAINHELMGHRDLAVRTSRESLQMARELATLDPSNVEWQRSLAIGTMRMATLEQDQASSLSLMREAHAKIEEAIRKAPDLQLYAVDRALMTARHGMILLRHGDRDGIELLQQSVRELEQYPDVSLARYKLARNLLFLGEAVASTQPAQARTYWARAEQVMPATVIGGEEFADRARLLIRLGRNDEARLSLVRLQQNGYATAELERLCREQGCWPADSRR